MPLIRSNDNMISINNFETPFYSSWNELFNRKTLLNLDKIQNTNKI